MKKVSVICFFCFVFIFIIGFYIGSFTANNLTPKKQDNMDANIGLHLSSESAHSDPSCDTMDMVGAYESISNNHGYYLMAINSSIYVYYEDKQRIFYKTELTLEDFPESIQHELMKGKYLASESEVYAFLESYTS